VTYIAHTAYLTTETLDNQEKTTTVAPLPVLTIEAAAESSVSHPAPNPTLTPAPTPSNNTATVTLVLTLSQSATSSTFQDANEDAGQSKPNTVVIIGGAIVGLSVTSILLFSVYLMWRRKQRATLDLSSPRPLGEPPYGSGKESRMHIAPFPQSGE
jgi:hypothetical protein